jgi:2-C-methyl-D-erythritol 2,4-cyclodiphosphate synthase
MSVITRVGTGYDLHRLEPGAKLIIAGVEIPACMGLSGHSDADVGLHAIIDAMLGAAGLGDIGEQFPDTDSAYKDIDSSRLITLAKAKIEECGFVCVNVDVTIIAEKPKLSAHKNQMGDRVAQLLDLDISAVSIKAKTNEGMDAVGRSEAIACHAIVGLTER